MNPHRSFFIRQLYTSRFGFFQIGNFSSSKTSQSAKQQTSQATGLNSIATGDGAQISRNVFGDKNLAKNDLWKPIAFSALAAAAITWSFKRKR